MAGLNQIYRGAENKAICGKLGRASKTFVGNEKKKNCSEESRRFPPSSSALRSPLPPAPHHPRRRRISRHDAQDGAGLVYRRHRRLFRGRQRVAAVPPRRLELLRRHPLRRLLLLPAPLRHRGRRPLRQRYRLRHLQLVSPRPVPSNPQTLRSGPLSPSSDLI